jgi:hypothetical protein
MEKIDFKKVLKHLYNPSAKEVVIVDVPKMNFAMVDGIGDPGNAEFMAATEALYSVSYTLKFMIKNGPAKSAVDYGVPPLEGLWWADDMKAFRLGKRDEWKWTLMIMQPEFITKTVFKEALERAKEKKGFPAIDDIRFESFKEGKSAQIMHIGPYAEEAPTIEKIHAFAKDNGYALTGKHHEIYLSDPRKAKPEKMKTVIRQPMKKG